MAANDENADIAKPAKQIPIVCPGHTRPLAEVQFCHVAEEDRTFLVSACHDRLPMVRDGTTGDWIGTFEGHKGAVWSCRMDNTGNLAATASGDFSVQVWDAITGKSWRSFPHKHIVKTVDFSPDSRLIVTGGHEGIVRIFDLTKEGEKQTTTEPMLEFALESSSPDKKVIISKANWLSDTVLLVGGNDGKVRCFDIAQGENNSGQSVHVFETQDAEVRDMETKKIATGQNILTVAAGNTVYFFDIDSRALLKQHKMPIHFKNEGGASLHPDGTKFVAGGSDLWVRVFDFESGQELECCKGHHGPIRCLRYSVPHAEVYASGSEDGTIRLWKTQ
mmetsp:Transcript_20149/g.25978  ORF Transcript_20149/g.25978 Transcript_20149/m.25978 type:complete len:333 (-) Transcript_20149:42-1040(-)